MVSRKGKPVLRDARADEAGALQELAARARAAMDPAPSSLPPQTTPDDFAELLVIELGEQLAGWAGLRVGRTDDELEVPALYVEPSLARRGLGSMLLAEVRRRAVRRKASRLLLSGPRQAEAFCRATGGTLVARSGETSPADGSARFEYPLELTIRLAERGDADDISELVAGLATAFLLAPDVDDDVPLLRSFTPDAIARYVTGEQYWYYVAQVGERIVGVAAVRDDGHLLHLFHLFVAPDWQGLGISARLWEATCQAVLDDEGEADGSSTFTVNSSLRAVPVFERFGFVVQGPRVEKNGIAFVPMRLENARQPHG